jgi:hypothetical protein
VIFNLLLFYWLGKFVLCKESVIYLEVLRLTLVRGFAGLVSFFCFFAKSDIERNFKRLNNKAENLRKKLLKNYNGQRFQSCAGNVRKTWAVSRKILYNKSSARPVVSKILGSGSQLVYNKVEIANEFNNFFVSVGAELAVLDNMGASEETTMVFNNDSSVNFYPTNDFEIVQAITGLKSGASASAGPDKISVRFLKDCCNFLVPHLTRMVNSCITDAEFPDALKIAKVTL